MRSFCFLSLLLDPEDGGSILLRNLCEYPSGYTALCDKLVLVIVTGVRITYAA
jgi:hypothetical protein